MHFIGLDAGSVAVKLVVLDEKGTKLEGHYLRHYGHPVREAVALLREVSGRYPGSSLSVTGSSGKAIATTLGIRHSNEVVSQAHATKRLFPHVKTIIELGGEDSKLILIEDGRVRDFAMNSVCAAGTGSFLEQQAERLRLTIEEFSEMAEQSGRPSKIAGRCSVFAKSDMIHLQQIATPVEDIVAGLCFAVARNFKGAIVKGRDLVPPVAFQGGVAANKGMVRAFREVFGLETLIVPPDFALMGAIGAAMRDMDDGRIQTFDITAFDSLLQSLKASEQGHRPLLTEGDDFIRRHVSGNGAGPKKAFTASGRKAYLGIDIGSISTNLAVIDQEGNLLAKRYLMTAGRPIEAVRQGLSEVAEELGDSVEICGVGTTGSGRYMIADYVGADIVKNEITAQATAAIAIDPTVDTILEIGGQDSKYISIRDGIIVDFEMNKACAAGTGSFIEEQAEKLDISVKGEFAECAFRAQSPCRLGERCTVFMENSLMTNLQKGMEKEDLLAGLAYSIVQNYVNRVVAGKPIGEKVFFQGGVAFNKSVVAAFEKYLEKEVIVPPNHDVTGAIGMALIAQEFMEEQGTEHRTQTTDDPSLPPLVKEGRRTKFKGFELSQRPYEISSFECRGCSNVCEINRVKVQGEEGNLFYGGRCEKYDVRKAKNRSIPDLFSFREEMLWQAHNSYLEKKAASGGKKQAVTIGIPYIFFFHDYLPYWATLLWELGYDVQVSPKTNKQVVNLGVESVLSEACFPVKVAHGHIAHLRDAGVDAIFVPSFINTNYNGDEYSKGLACPHTQTIPYVSRVAIRGIRTITPTVDFSLGSAALRSTLLSSLREFGVQERELEQAMVRAKEAQDRFQEALREKGREVLEAIRDSSTPAVAIMGRAYNAFDPGMNLEIPAKLAQIEVLSIPMDFLPLSEERIEESWPNMYWRSGQRILKAARMVRRTAGLYAIYIGNFSCGPDSFILKYFSEEMKDKPFLHLEIDEHSADAGAVTRCEAFLDSIEQQNRGRLHATAQEVAEQKVASESGQRHAPAPSLRKRKVYIPCMADHAYALQAAFEYCGVSAEVLPQSDRDSVDLGRRYVSGKECYPYLVTAGDMLKKALAPDFRPGESAFFMPSGTGPCRFGQYNVSHKLILEKLGMGEVPIFAPNQDVEFYKDLGIVGRDFSRRAWSGIISYELLTKCLHETRPYELTAGDADEAHSRYHEKIYQTLKSRRGNLRALMEEMRDVFTSIPRRREKRPLIGVTGEIFVRSHRFSNEEVVRKIESLGGEVWLAPIEEWIHYVNTMSLRRAMINKERSAMMGLFLKGFFQKKAAHSLEKPFRGFLKTLHEPTTKEIIEKAAPYVHESFEGETILSIGKAVDLIEKGATGIINVMPFGCMPGTIVTSLMKAVSRDHNVPCVSLPYDGNESSTTELQLEAFMEAVCNRS